MIRKCITNPQFHYAAKKMELVHQMIDLDHMYGPLQDGDIMHLEND